jgi:hypothetical protein
MSPLKYEVEFYIPEDGILHSQGYKAETKLHVGVREQKGSLPPVQTSFALKWGV